MLDPLSRLSFVPGLARTSTNSAMLAKLDAYAAEHLPPEARRSADTARAGVADRIRVVQERLATLDEWLRKNAG
jgi:aminopeptidase N